MQQGISGLNKQVMRCHEFHVCYHCQEGPGKARRRRAHKKRFRAMEKQMIKREDRYDVAPTF